MKSSPLLPLHVRACADPLKNCWSTNVSAVLAAEENVVVFIFAIGKPLPYSVFVM